MEERGRKRREEGREQVRRRKGRTLLNDQRLLEEEHGLLPVRRRSLRSSREEHLRRSESSGSRRGTGEPSVGREERVKVAQEGVHRGCFAGGEGEEGLEGELGDGDGLRDDVLRVRASSISSSLAGRERTHPERNLVRNDFSRSEHVNQSLLVNLLLHRLHLVPIHVVPERDAVVDERRAVEEGEEDRALRRDHEARRLHEPLARVQD